MAKNSSSGEMIFPIKFDLETAVTNAGKDWEEKYAEKLEKKIQKKALAVKLKFDDKSLDNLDAVRQRLAQLKIEPITPETKAAIKDLAKELRDLAKALEQVQKYATMRNPTKQAVNNSRISANEAKAAAANELARQRAAKAALAEERLAVARSKSAAAAARNVAATNQLNLAYRSQESYLNRLAKRMVAYWSVGQVFNFLTAIREVTAQFELQRVSLGAIIQDQVRANELFSQIKTFALQSPMSIMDLTKYTKQVAAYGIETEKLFGTTKMLADIAVGLGVDMGRVALAYGQVFATGYLRASEVRQFTEMGVPIVATIADKLTQVNGELVTAKEVMDMISKRAISFEMVNEVFTDMTSSGGMFFDMQKKQSETLFGMWAKLGDAASIMYDEIGNNASVNKGMKAMIDWTTELMRNWDNVARMVGVVGAGLAAMSVVSKVRNANAANVAAQQVANQKYIAASNAYRAALQAETIARRSATQEEYRAIVARTEAARATYLLAQAEYQATRSTTVLSKAWSKFTAKLKANWVMLVITALAALGMHLYNAHQEANKLKKALAEIDKESNIEQMKSVRNFESLAKIAVEAADGTMTQKKALDELNRTYKDIIPQERLTLEHLRSLKGEYDSLTVSIKNYVAEQMKQKKINTIVEDTATTIAEKEKNIKDNLKNTLDAATLERLLTEYQRIIEEAPTKYLHKKNGTWALALIQAAERVGVAIDELNLNANMREFRDMSESIAKQITQIEAIGAAWDTNYRALLNYSKPYGKLMQQVNEMSVGVDADKSPFLYSQQKLNNQISKAIIPTLKQIMGDAHVAWQDGWANIIETVSEAEPQLISSVDFNAIRKWLKENASALTDEQRKAFYGLENIYANLSIPDEVVRHNRQVAITLAEDMREALSKIGDGSKNAVENIKKYFMESGKTVKEYGKSLKDALEKQNNTVFELSQVAAPSQETLKKLEDAKTIAEYLQRLLELLDIPEDSKSRRSADPRLQSLTEIADKMAQINREYEELRKKEGDTKALADTRLLFGGTFEEMQRVIDKHKFLLPKLDVPQTAQDVQEWYDRVVEEIKRLKIKNADKTAVELSYKADKTGLDYIQKDIENTLKEIQDRIARTKTAKEFYDKLIAQTGDVELAANISFGVYSSTGGDLNAEIRKQIEEVVKNTSATLDKSIFRTDGTFDAKKLREFANAQIDALGGIESNAYQTLIKLSEDAEKDFAKTISDWLKQIEKAKSYSDKLLDLANKTKTEIANITTYKGYATQRVAELSAMGALTSEQQAELDRLKTFLATYDNLIKGFEEKQAQEQSKLAYEAFKDSPMYVQMFDDLDHASTRMLENMRTRISQMKEQWKDLEPTQLKELQSRLNEIDKQLATRNPFKALADGYKQLRNLRKEGDTLGNTSRKAADKALADAAIARINAEKEYLALLKDEKATEEDVAAAKEKYDNAARDEEDAANAAATWKDVADNIELSSSKLLEMMNWAGDIAHGIADISEVMGASEEDVQYYNDIASAFDDISSGISDIVNAALSGDVMGMVSASLTAIPKMFVGFVKLFNAGRVRAANKEIKRQEELLANLQYAYDRLAESVEKAFGAEFIQQHNRQLELLQAQADAYQAQADAERSKGKDADESAAVDFENQKRDILNQIDELNSAISERMLGSDITAAARSFAQAWLDAYKEFGNTADAMSKKFSEMVENMVIEGALAQIMKRALQPMFDMIDGMSDRDFYSESFWKRVVATAEKGAKDADAGAASYMKFLEQAGLSIRNLGGEMTGISREISTASEESINGLAVELHTFNYYGSHIPTISANVAEIRMIMKGGNASNSLDTTALWNQHIELQQGIYRHTQETVKECREIARQCTAMAADIHKVVIPKGSTTAAFAIATRLQ